MKTLVVDQASNENLDGLIQRHPSVTSFFLRPGTYHLTEQLVIDRENISLQGLGSASDVHIVQDTPGANGIVITASQVTLHHVSVHAEVGSGIAVTHADVNFVQIEHCHFYGSEEYFAVYLAGKTHNGGADTLAAFASGDLDHNNTFDNNIVYSKWSGDAVSFSLQRFGSLRNNIVRGGKVAVYMTQDCIVGNNRIYDSTSHGIICSMPSLRLRLTHNHIARSTASGIALKPQVEHGEHQPQADSQVIVDNNTVDGGEYIGIELENSNGVEIRENHVRHVQTTGIYVLRSANVSAHHNHIVGCDRAVFIDVETSGCVFENNEMFSLYPNVSQNAFLIEATSLSTRVANNTTHGPYLSDVIKDVDPDNSLSQIVDNVHDAHIDHHEEVLLWITQ